MFNFLKNSLLICLLALHLQPIQAMQNKQSFFSISNIYGTITEYLHLPKFSLPSLPFLNFLTKYYYRKPSPEDAKNALTIFLAYVYRLRANKKLLDIIETVLEHNKMRKKNCKQIQACLEYGADPKLKFGPKKLPLISLAVLYKQKKLFDYLLQRGAYGDEWTFSDVKNVNNILLKTIKSMESYNDKEENWKKVKECLYHRANPDLKFEFKDIFGYRKEVRKIPLLSLIIKYQKKDIFDLLLQLGVNINACDTTGETPLYTLIKLVETPKFIKIEDLLKNGANPNIRPKNNYISSTPLHMAIVFRSNFDIKPLIDYKADVNAKDINNCLGRTPLYKAIQCGGYHIIDVIKTLCDGGASVETENDDRTVFDFLYYDNQFYDLFKPIIEHARFDFEKENNGMIKKALLILKYASPIYENSDIRFLILSKLIEDYPHKGLYEELTKKNYSLKPRPLLLVNKHVNHLIQIIAKEPNIQKESSTANFIAMQRREFAINELKSDLSIFNTVYLYNLTYPEKENPPLPISSSDSVLAIYKNQYASLETNPITFAF